MPEVMGGWSWPGHRGYAAGRPQITMISQDGGRRLLQRR